MAAWAFVKEMLAEWSDDRAPRLGAALAYYTVFSLAPILVIVIGIAGVFFGRDIVQGQLLDQIGDLIGAQGVEAVRTMVASASEQRGKGVVATLLGFGALVFGASGAFAELQDSLNQIWDVQPKAGRGILGIMRDRFLSFSMVLGIGFLLLVSLVLSALLTAMGTLFGSLVPVVVMQSVNTALSFGVVTLLFALIYKVLPDVDIEWRDVWLGSVVTALLFTLGKFAIGLYLGKSGLATAYGAAGSLVVVLVWVYYSAQILFLGAEFTQVWARRRGRGLRPAAIAEPRAVEGTRQPAPVDQTRSAA
jgi:membrane protein